MRKIFTQLTCAAAAIASLAITAGTASAACTKLGFEVNDYGKEGPTNDAKALLDKYIAKWAAEKGIAKYTTGQKNVTCELFLNFIIFDEHTCKAEATVCWDGPAVKGGTTAAAGDVAAPAEKKATKAAAVKPAKVDTLAPVETGSTNAPAAEKAAPAATEPAAETAAPAATAPAPQTETKPEAPSAPAQ